MLQNGQRVEPDNFAAGIAVAVAGARASVGDVAHDRAGVAADLFRHLLGAGIVRFEALGKFAHFCRASASRIAARMREGVAGTLVTMTPVA